jgi:NADP-dependent 3-hydroxy acid dehydrogenase YdfG
MSRLTNKVAVITGGNSGIGFGIAEAFKNEGATGTITGRNQETLDRSVHELGTGFLEIKGDVTVMEDLERIFKKTFDRFGKIDTLVVNAGGIVDGVGLHRGSNGRRLRPVHEPESEEQLFHGSESPALPE